ncbi:molybdopterin converting factor subunit 1 [Nisaea acidiphila]|uniref:Molybdopterin synthase sulfur carrier subunit n=1 Tax=Nisaea acidiphila TaxID=1862145 RepID=A0A9J7APH2_9PROT|nr:molybdopterin converting factor subunit 1 [Nisaea acidiphila]UUX49111.1 molybdopterin converting factor subunit 1 [Nisaea acidiphila]
MKILYFAWMRGKTGIGEEDVAPPAEVTDVAGLIGWLKTRGPGFEDAFANMDVVRAAVNQEFVELDAPVKAGDEVAFFPPVTGG